jgi:predicted TIM-barrel fold metal-dependent hydrolase
VIDGIFVVDGIAHAFDWRPERRVGVQGQLLAESVLAGLQRYCPPEAMLPPAELVSRYGAGNTARAYFLESDVDLAVTHHVPLYSYLRGGLVTIEDQRELLERWPQRWIAYAGVDPTVGVAEAIESLDRQLELIPATVGVKLYPSQVEPLRSLYLDDRRFFPLWEHVRDRGLKVIAVHKNSVYGPVPGHPFRVGDVEEAAAAFPELMFELVHGGVAFTEETATAIGRFPNVFTNLELTCWLLFRAPGRFEEIMAQFMLWGGPEKIIWGTGGPAVHPQPLLERFLAFEFSEQTLYRHGIAQITREQKAMILGGSYARMIGLDLEAAGRGIEDDEFAQAQRANGLEPLYSTWTSTAAEAAVQ